MYRIYDSLNYYCSLYVQVYFPYFNNPIKGIFHGGTRYRQDIGL